MSMSRFMASWRKVTCWCSYFKYFLSNISDKNFERTFLCFRFMSLFHHSFLLFHCYLTIIYGRKSFVFFYPCVPLVGSDTINVRTQLHTDGRTDGRKPKVRMSETICISTVDDQNCILIFVRIIVMSMSMCGLKKQHVAL